MFVTDIRKEFYDVVVNQVRNSCFVWVWLLESFKTPILFIFTVNINS